MSQPLPSSSIMTYVVFLGHVPHCARYCMEHKRADLPQGVLCFVLFGPLFLAGSPGN